VTPAEAVSSRFETAPFACIFSKDRAAESEKSCCDNGFAQGQGSPMQVVVAAFNGGKIT